MKKIFKILYKYRKELLFLSIFIALAQIHVELSAIYLSFELGFIVSTALAVYYRAKSKYTPAMRWYLVNRFIGLLQPLATLFGALFIRMSIAQEIEIELLMLFDITITILSLQVFTEHFSPIRVRVAKRRDVDALVRIEEKTFNEEQRASREQIIRRLETHDNTCLVAIHRKRGIVGSFYLRPVNKAEIISKKMSHKEIQNHDDFSRHPEDDCLYAVGLQALPCGRIHVSAYLDAALLKMAIERGYKGILGGPRLPEYHNYPELTLEQFIHSRHAKFLQYLIESSYVPGFPKLEVITGLKNYFPDPDSLDAAALVWWPTPFLWAPVFLRKIIANILYIAAIAS